MRVAIGLAAVALALALTCARAGAEDLQCGGERGGVGYRIVINKAQARCAWPFKVDRVALVCGGDRRAAILTVESGGRHHALNGLARSAARRLDLLPIEAIAKPAALGEWIAAALQACPDR